VAGDATPSLGTRFDWVSVDALDVTVVIAVIVALREEEDWDVSPVRRVESPVVGALVASSGCLAVKRRALGCYYSTGTRFPAGLARQQRIAVRQGVLGLFSGGGLCLGPSSVSGGRGTRVCVCVCVCVSFRRAGDEE
jgi:hypothetical protein